MELKFWKKTNIDGIVIKKYIDSNQHSFPIIEWENKLKLIDTLNLVRDTSNLFSVIKPFDTIKKELNSIIIKIKRKDTAFERAIDFGCQKK